MPTRTADHTRTRGFKKKERTRKQLIAAAVDVIAERGEAFSISDVTDRAGVSNGTFYNYFDDRDALVRAIVPEVVGSFATNSAATVADQDPAVRFASITAMALTRAVTTPDEILVLLRLDAAQQAIAGGTPIRHLQEDLAAGFATGRFTVEPSDAALDVIAGSILTAARRLATGGANEAYSCEVIAILLHTLGVADSEAKDIAQQAMAEVASMRFSPKTISRPVRD